MPSQRKNRLSAIPLQTHRAIPGGNPLNPYDALPTLERLPKLIAVLARAYCRLVRSTQEIEKKKVS